MLSRGGGGVEGGEDAAQRHTHGLGHAHTQHQQQHHKHQQQQQKQQQQQQQRMSIGPQSLAIAKRQEEAQQHLLSRIRDLEAKIENELKQRAHLGADMRALEGRNYDLRRMLQERRLKLSISSSPNAAAAIAALSESPSSSSSPSSSYHEPSSSSSSVRAHAASTSASFSSSSTSSSMRFSSKSSAASPRPASSSVSTSSAASSSSASLALDASCFLADSNAILRAQLAELASMKGRLALQLTELTPEERTRLVKELSPRVFQHPIATGDQRPYQFSVGAGAGAASPTSGGGSAATSPQALRDDWQKLAASLSRLPSSTSSNGESDGDRENRLADFLSIGQLHPSSPSAASTTSNGSATSTGGEGDSSSGSTTDPVDAILHALEVNQSLYADVLHATRSLSRSYPGPPNSGGGGGDVLSNGSLDSNLLSPLSPDALCAGVSGSLLLSAMSTDFETDTNYGFSLNVAPDFEYEFDEPDSPSNIVFKQDDTAHAQIHLATLNKLVERITHEDNSSNDLNTRFVFLLTKDSFTSSKEVLHRLTRRYYVPTPPNLTPKESNTFKEKKLSKIQIKVFSVIKFWLESHWDEDFSRDEDLVWELKAFLRDTMKESAGRWAKKSASGILKMISNGEAGRSRVTHKMSDTPKPLIRSDLPVDSFDLLIANEKEIARQLTLQDYDVFQKIQARECLSSSWRKEGKQKSAPNISAMIDCFNRVTSWVQLEILQQHSQARRSRMLAKFVKIAEHCEELNNFNSMYAIFCGLNANPIHRLKQTFDNVKSTTVQKVAHMRELFSPDFSYKNLRAVLKTTLTPCIPHIGLFLADLTFIEDGNVDTINDMINFSKRRRLADRIMWIKQYQQESYQLEKLDVVHQYFKKKVVEVDENTLWNMSLKVEPRQ